MTFEERISTEVAKAVGDWTTVKGVIGAGLGLSKTSSSENRSYAVVVFFEKGVELDEIRRRLPHELLVSLTPGPHMCLPVQFEPSQGFIG